MVSSNLRDKEMSTRRILKLIHLASTIWFIVCIGFVLILTLHEAGFNWWFIFSLSGHSAVIILLLISLYLFVIYRQIHPSSKAIEHPLTTTIYYRFFYDITPFLGGIAGCIGMIGVIKVSQFFLGITLGTLGATFLVWIIIDPLAGSLETFLPSSRKYRTERLKQVKAIREMKQKQREQLLAEVLEKEDLDRCRWQDSTAALSEKLVALLTNDEINSETEKQAVDIGIKAWQIGGLNCMRHLYDLTRKRYKKEINGNIAVGYITSWWDGIGNWRNQWLKETYLI